MSVFEEGAGPTVGDWGEARLIERIAAWLGPEVTPGSPYGIGDDAAVVPREGFGEGHLLMTTDPVIHGRHFDDEVPPEEAGAKLLKRNISDLAAMGGKADSALLALTMGPTVAQAWLERFIHGLGEAARRYAVQVRGGDVAEVPGPHFSAALFLTGWAARPLTRKGAAPGDEIWVTGALGGSLRGRHAHFEPRQPEGLWLAAEAPVTSMIDLSDGLAKDLPALLAGGCAAQLELEAIPVHDDAIWMSRRTGNSPLHHALCDGEDYELLFTVAPGLALAKWVDKWSRQFGVALTRIGTVIQRSEGRPLLLDRHGNPAPGGTGFTHFG